VNGSKYVVVGEQMVKAQVFDRSPELPHSGGISPKLGLGVRDANLHEPQLPTKRALMPEAARCKDEGRDAGIGRRACPLKAGGVMLIDPGSTAH
jgi:hypothetical protein